MQVLEKLKLLLQVIALAIFCVQMMYALEKYMAGPTMTAGEHRTLSSLDQPILLAICKTSQFDLAKSLGYGSLGDYITGATSNESVLSWSGKDGNMTTEMFSNPSKASVSGVENVTNKFLLPFGMCSIAKGRPQNFFKGGLHKVSVMLEEEGEYMVYVLDPSTALHYQLPTNQMTGDRPRIRIGSTPTRKYYSVKLKERRVLTGDGSCAIYPGKTGHDSFADCVDEENQKKILPVLGCMVPWMSDRDQCKGLIERLPKQEDLIKWLGFVYDYAKPGFIDNYNSCPPPCTTLTATGKYLYTNTEKKGFKVKINFDEDIEVESVVPAYGFGDLLVEIGSSLGLWLGLSVVGVFDVLGPIMTKIRSVARYTSARFHKTK